MGCCFSRPEGPNSPYPGGASTASARPINAPAAATASPADEESSTSPTSPSRPRHRPQQPLSQHINKPLRRHEWASRHRTWTRSTIDRERTDYFDTRVTGRPEVWQTLRAALEVLWEADVRTRQGVSSSSSTDEQDPVVALATAQGILTAADITLPTGDLAQGAYDQLGNYYPLPEWIVADPANLDQETKPALGDAKGDLGSDEVSADDGEVLDTEEAERRREEKGKAVVNIRDQINVRARLSENSHDVIISLSKDETVRSLIRRITQEARLPSTTRIRIGYLGKILKETSPLIAQGWKDGHVVNAFMFDTR